MDQDSTANTILSVARAVFPDGAGISLREALEISGYRDVRSTITVVHLVRALKKIHHI